MTQQLAALASDCVVEKEKQLVQLAQLSKRIAKTHQELGAMRERRMLLQNNVANAEPRQQALSVRFASLPILCFPVLFVWSAFLLL